MELGNKFIKKKKNWLHLLLRMNTNGNKEGSNENNLNHLKDKIVHSSSLASNIRQFIVNPLLIGASLSFGMCLGYAAFDALKHFAFRKEENGSSEGHK